MNAVEIEEAVSKLAEQPFDAASFPFDFLAHERIYIGRRFKNDTERLETLIDLHTKMAGAPTSPSAWRMKKPMMGS